MSGPVLHGGGIYEAARLYGGRAEDWLDLSTGINPNPVKLPDVPMSAWHRLPDRHLVNRARQAAQGWYRSGAALPLPVPGTQAFIQILPRLVNGGRPVAILSPTYGEYARSFIHAGFAVDEISNLAQLTKAHGALVIANPNNPDGHVLSRDMVMALADRMARQNGHLIVDEAFGDGRPELSVAAQAGDHPGLIVSRSFGKFFGLAGLRLGFIIANPDMLERLDITLGPWPVSGPALHIAAELMAGSREAICGQIGARHQAMGDILAHAGLTIAGSTNLFVLVTHRRASDLHRHLCQSHILVRKFGYADQWLRFGLTPDLAGDRRLTEALRRAKL